MRLILGILAVVSIVIGLMSLIAGGLSYSNEYLEHVSLNGAVLVCGILIGVFLIIAASLGLYGIAQNKRLCLFIYCITLAVVSAVLLFLAIAVIYAKKEYRS